LLHTVVDTALDAQVPRRRHSAGRSVRLLLSCRNAVRGTTSADPRTRLVHCASVPGGRDRLRRPCG
jgi:hypothetical protein